MTFVTVLAGAIPLVVLICIAVLIERAWPVCPQPFHAVRFDLIYMLLYSAMQAIAMRGLSVFTIVAVNQAGGGWITLPDAGWPLLPGLILYVFTLDLLEYLFHRVQHRVPFMWSMHSFHHSDTVFNAATTTRHYWADQGIKMMTVYLVAGMLFKANPPILAMYAVLSFNSVFAHMNIRGGSGRPSLVMNSPQYHRLHHSTLPEHQDCNFAALFPIMDVLFGTCRIPNVSEYPDTGLSRSEQPIGWLDAVLWPIRNRIR